MYACRFEAMMDMRMVGIAAPNRSTENITRCERLVRSCSAASSWLSWICQIATRMYSTCKLCKSVLRSRASPTPLSKAAIYLPCKECIKNTIPLRAMIFAASLVTKNRSQWFAASSVSNAPRSSIAAWSERSVQTSRQVWKGMHVQGYPSTLDDFQNKYTARL